MDVGHGTDGQTNGRISALLGAILQHALLLFFVSPVIAPGRIACTQCVDAVHYYTSLRGAWRGLYVRLCVEHTGDLCKNG